MRGSQPPNGFPKGAKRGGFERRQPRRASARKSGRTGPTETQGSGSLSGSQNSRVESAPCLSAEASPHP